MHKCRKISGIGLISKEAFVVIFYFFEGSGGSRPGLGVEGFQVLQFGALVQAS